MFLTSDDFFIKRISTSEYIRGKNVFNFKNQNQIFQMFDQNGVCLSSEADPGFNPIVAALHVKPSTQALR